MSIFSLIIKEIVHRRVNFLLSLLAVIITVALFTFFLTTGEGSKRETSRLMRDLGFNLRIISKNTDMEIFFAEGYSDQTLPDDCVLPLADLKGVSFNHLVSILQKKVQWRDKEVMLTGFASEISPLGKRKSPMIFSIEKGDVYLGYAIATSRGVSKGDSIDFMGETFKVRSCLSQKGDIDDITVYAHLSDVQRLLKMEGKINEIKALECLCSDPDADSLALLSNQLEKTIPDGKVIQLKTIADAREKQRRMADRYFAMVSPFVIAVCALWIATLAMINVHDREREIGILRALGYRSSSIAILFLGRAMIMGVVGATVGYFIGIIFSLWFGPDVFEVTAGSIKPVWDLFIQSLIAAPVFSALSSFIPTLVAVTKDPALTLGNE